MTQIGSPRDIEILLVEDNPGDVRLTKEALREAEIRNTLHVVQDGDDALAFLRKMHDYATATRPDLILLDLNLPRRSGREVLEVVKADVELRRIPVIILTTLDSNRDVLESYDLHANCYITKPTEMQGFLDVVRVIEDFWFTIVKLPER